MDEITALFSIDLPDVVMSVFVILFGVLAIMKLIEGISQRVGKPIKWLSTQNRDHELLQQTMNDLKLLTEHHYSDMQDEANRDELLEQQLSRFAEDIKNSVQQLADNRVHDREQSLEIQKELNESITKLTEGAVEREKAVSALSEGVRELLGNEMDKMFSKYVSLNGVPENELDEYTSMANAYFANGGNHKRKERYLYVIEHMHVIPVEVNLLGENEVDKKPEG